MAQVISWSMMMVTGEDGRGGMIPSELWRALMSGNPHPWFTEDDVALLRRSVVDTQVSEHAVVAALGDSQEALQLESIADRLEQIAW